MFSRRAALAAALAYIALKAGAFAQPVIFGRAILSYQAYDTEDLSSRGFHQIYDLAYDRNITIPLHLRLAFRGEGNDGRSDFGTAQTRNSIWDLRPSGELDYSIPKLNFQTRYDLLDTKTDNDDQENHRRVQRIAETLSWRPDSAPSLTLYGSQQKLVDAQAGLNQTENRFLESLSKTLGALTIGETVQYSTMDLGLVGFDRKTLEVQGNLRYENSFLGGRASVSGTAIGGLTRLDEAAGPSSSARVPTQVPISVASYARDDTPLDSRDNVPVPDPRLSDNDLVTRTTINVGPTGQLYQNLVTDMGRVIALDNFRIFVRDSGGNLVPTAGLLRWDVYTSDNNLDWRSLPGGAITTYIFALSAYEVTFVSTPSRYFKVVSFGTNSNDAFVTELEAFFHTEISKSELRRTDVKFVSANVNLSGTPSKWLTLRYAGLFNNFQTAQPDRPQYNTMDNTHQFSAEISPTSHWNGTLRYETERFGGGGTPTQNMETYWGIFRYSGNRNLNTALELSRISEHGSTELVTDTARLYQYLRLYRNLELSADGGIGRDQFPLTDLQDRRVFVNTTSYLQLVRTIRVTLSANFQRTEYSGSGAAALPATETRDGRYYGEIFFRPSGQLLLSGRFGYVTGSFVTATTKTWRVEWYPFARGTIGIGTIYDEDVETNGTYRRFRRVQILPRWQVNRHVIVDVNYSYLTLMDEGIGIPTPVTQSKTKQLYLNLTWVL